MYIDYYVHVYVCISRCLIRVSLNELWWKKVNYLQLFAILFVFV